MGTLSVPLSTLKTDGLSGHPALVNRLQAEMDRNQPEPQVQEMFRGRQMEWRGPFD